MKNNWIKYKRFYAVITEESVGIFTEWSEAKALSNGVSNRLKGFSGYYQALEFLLSCLTLEEIQSFGLDKHKPVFNQVITKHVVW